MYTEINVRNDTNVKLDCSHVKSTFLTQNNITNESAVSTRWLFAEQAPDLKSFIPFTPLSEENFR